MNLRIALLCVSPSVYTTRRLYEAAEAHGHSMTTLAAHSISLTLEGGKLGITYRGRPLDRFDTILPRIGSTAPDSALAVLRQFALMGAHLVNPLLGIERARDKLAALQVLAANGIPIATTVMVGRATRVTPSLETVGEGKVVVKFFHGAQGVGVMLAESRATAAAIIESMHAVGREVLAQRFVAECEGRDLRLFVVDGRVTAAIERRARSGEFRSNIHRGAEAHPVTVDPRWEDIAVSACEALSLRIAGVDIVDSEVGPLVLEVNASPGLEGIESATGIDVAGAIIAAVEKIYERDAGARAHPHP